MSATQGARPVDFGSVETEKLVGRTSAEILVPGRYVAAILLIMPALYMLNSLTPWSRSLFAHHDHRLVTWTEFWVSVMVLHWSSVAAVVWVLHANGRTLRDLGIATGARRTFAVLASILVIGCLFFVARDLLGPVPFPFHGGGVPIFGEASPHTTLERFLMIPIAFSAAFCEELVYRGFAITALERLGVGVWPACCVAAVSWVFLHGISAFGHLGYLLLGAALFSLIYLATRRLLPGIVVHALNDLLAVLG